jgi:hypothetical protein
VIGRPLAKLAGRDLRRNPAIMPGVAGIRHEASTGRIHPQVRSADSRREPTASSVLPEQAGRGW